MLRGGPGSQLPVPRQLRGGHKSPCGAAGMAASLWMGDVVRAASGLWRRNVSVAGKEAESGEGLESLQKGGREWGGVLFRRRCASPSYLGAGGQD